MMKLRHLFNNPALAEMLLKNWEYDETSLDLFQYFRISANAIYPFKKDGEVRFLRCCPTSEKTKDNILAELEFVNYLRSNQYNALEPIPPKNGNELIQKSTPWGEYYASVFKHVMGKQISETDFSAEIMLDFRKGNADTGNTVIQGLPDFQFFRMGIQVLLDLLGLVLRGNSGPALGRYLFLE